MHLAGAGGCGRRGQLCTILNRFQSEIYTDYWASEDSKALSKQFEVTYQHIAKNIARITHDLANIRRMVQNFRTSFKNTPMWSPPLPLGPVNYFNSLSTYFAQFILRHSCNKLRYCTLSSYIISVAKVIHLEWLTRSKTKPILKSVSWQRNFKAPEK